MSEVEEKTFMLMNEEDIVSLHAYLEDEMLAGRRPMVIVTTAAKPRTLTQNRALHQFFRMLASQLNAAGFDMRKTLRDDIEIPWSGTAVKEYLWRPVQIAVHDQESTAKVTTKDYQPVYDTLARHLASRLGIRIPDWPSRQSQEPEYSEREAA